MYGTKNGTNNLHNLSWNVFIVYIVHAFNALSSLSSSLPPSLCLCLPFLTLSFIGCNLLELDAYLGEKYTVFLIIMFRFSHIYIMFLYKMC
jgi:uncharacterized membrane-anchored protein